MPIRAVYAFLIDSFQVHLYFAILEHGWANRDGGTFDIKDLDAETVYAVA